MSIAVNAVLAFLEAGKKRSSGSGLSAARSAVSKSLATCCLVVP
jgi:hypothetical protein